jgi:hypothetical protein
MKNHRKKSLLDGYIFPGFKTNFRAKGLFGDQSAIVLQLSRRQKKLYAVDAARLTSLTMIKRFVLSVISDVATGVSTLNFFDVEFFVLSVKE